MGGMDETVTTQGEVVTFKLPAEDKAELERIASEDDRTVSAVLRRLVRELITSRRAAA